MLITFLLSGIALGVGALFPESYLCFFLFLLSATLFSLALSSVRRIYLGSFLAGVCFHAIAFYWLCQTVQVFGGLNPFLGFLVMLLFCATGAIQFVLVAFFYRRLGRFNFLGSLVLPCAWLASFMIWPKLFPWEIGHGLIVLKPIAGLAEYVGVSPLSMLFIWWGVVLSNYYLKRENILLFKAIAYSLVLLAIGSYRNYQVKLEISQSPEVQVALIQGNLSLEVKGKQAFFNANLDKYLELSKKQSSDLIIWPESVVSKWLHRDLESIIQADLNFALNSPVLFGGLVYDLRDSAEIEKFIKAYPELATKQFLQSYSYKKFNAAIGIDKNGEILGQYYKKVLMPFGEYFPFSDRYPWLKQAFPMVGDFTPGEQVRPIKFPHDIKAAALICYEDLVPELSREAVNAGANLLVNLTNDAWYGDSPASHQHHLLALWRAIETRRFFLRSTNTGYTAVVSPLGESLENLPIFTENILLAKVRLLRFQTYYSFWGNWPTYFLNVIILICSFLPRRRKI